VAQVASKKLIPTLAALEEGCLEKVAPIFLASAFAPFHPVTKPVDIHLELRNKRHVACMQMSLASLARSSPSRTNKLRGSDTIARKNSPAVKASGLKLKDRDEIACDLFTFFPKINTRT